MYMKKISTLLLSCLASTALYAQPAFTTAPNPANGYSVSAQSITYTGADPATNTGANTSWDYSALQFSGTPSTSTIYTNVAGSAYGASFPTGSHYEVTAGGSYNYYSYTPTTVSVLGYFSSSVLVVLSDPLTQLTFPIAYTNVQTDTYAGSYTANGYPVTMNGTVSSSYDGYGTLITQNGTYNNIARFKLVKDETQVTDYGDDFTMAMRTVSTTYSWNLPGANNASFAIMYIDITIEDMPYGSAVVAYLYNNTTTGTTAPEMVTASLYPQPANDQVTIAAPGIEGVSQATLFKTDGAVLRKEDLTADGSGTMTLNVSDVPAGLYLLEIINGNKTVKQKVVVE